MVTALGPIERLASRPARVVAGEPSGKQARASVSAARFGELSKERRARLCAGE